MDELTMKTMFSAPIPGQSLTTDPSTPLPYEQPPEFTNIEKAQEWIFDQLTTTPRGEEALDNISRGVSIENLAIIIAFGGMQSGKWTVDLMLLLLEPIMYILLFLCEQAGVEYNLSDDEDDLMMDAEDNMKYKHGLEQIKKGTSKKVRNDRSNEKIQSLLAKFNVNEGTMQ